MYLYLGLDDGGCCNRLFLISPPGCLVCIVQAVGALNSDLYRTPMVCSAAHQDLDETSAATNRIINLQFSSSVKCQISTALFQSGGPDHMVDTVSVYDHTVVTFI